VLPCSGGLGGCGKGSLEKRREVWGVFFFIKELERRVILFRSFYWLVVGGLSA